MSRAILYEIYRRTSATGTGSPCLLISRALPDNYIDLAQTPDTKKLRIEAVAQLDTPRFKEPTIICPTRLAYVLPAYFEQFIAPWTNEVSNS